MFVKFPSIEGFDRVMSGKLWAAKHAPDTHEPVFSLRPKVKLHGTNCAIGAGPEGAWVQSRTEVLSAEKDSMGCWEGLHAAAELLLEANRELCLSGQRVVIFGEWAGQSIQKADAVTTIGKRAFFPFLSALVDPGYESPEDRGSVMVRTDPASIRAALGFEDENIIVLPWASAAVRFSSDDLDATAAALDSVNAAAESVGLVDPFILDAFGLRGPGEGLVFVPDTADGPVTLDAYARLSFKAKAERHRVKASARAATVRAEIPESAQAFADAFATANRMEQTVSDALGGELDKRRTGDFIRALVSDVMKESVPEREALGVEDRVLAGLLVQRAKVWFISACEGSWRPEP